MKYLYLFQIQCFIEFIFNLEISSNSLTAGFCKLTILMVIIHQFWLCIKVRYCMFYCINGYVTMLSAVKPALPKPIQVFTSDIPQWYGKNQQV